MHRLATQSPDVRPPLLDGSQGHASGRLLTFPKFIEFSRPNGGIMLRVKAKMGQKAQFARGK
jgi:hypothetical protein